MGPDNDPFLSAIKSTRTEPGTVPGGHSNQTVVSVTKDEANRIIASTDPNFVTTTVRMWAALGPCSLFAYGFDSLHKDYKSTAHGLGREKLYIQVCQTVATLCPILLQYLTFGSERFEVTIAALPTFVLQRRSDMSMNIFMSCLVGTVVVAFMFGACPAPSQALFVSQTKSN